MLLKKYKNQLYNIIKDSDYKVSYFKIDLYRDYPEIYRIKYKDSIMFFDIRTRENTFHKFDIRNAIFEKNQTKTPWSNGVEFINIIGLFQEWLKRDLSEYTQEINGEDLWSTAQSITNPFTLSDIDFNDSSPFQEEEKAQLKLGLNEVKVLLAENFEFTKNQNSIIKGRLKYLEESLDRNTKTDWKGIAISTIIGLILNLAVDKATGQAIWELFRKIFENLPHLPMH